MSVISKLLYIYCYRKFLLHLVEFCTEFEGVSSRNIALVLSLSPLSVLPYFQSIDEGWAILLIGSTSILMELFWHLPIFEIYFGHQGFNSDRWFPSEIDLTFALNGKLSLFSSR